MRGLWYPLNNTYILTVDIRVNLKRGFLLHLGHLIDQSCTLWRARPIPSLFVMVISFTFS